MCALHNLSLSLTIYLSIYRSIHLSISLSRYLSIFLSLYLSVSIQSNLVEFIPSILSTQSILSHPIPFNPNQSHPILFYPIHLSIYPPIEMHLNIWPYPSSHRKSYPARSPLSFFTKPLIIDSNSSLKGRAFSTPVCAARTSTGRKSRAGVPKYH